MNSPPTANNDSVATNHDVAVTIAVLANDTDVNGDTLTVTSLTQPLSGTAALNANGTVIYTPKAGFVGIDWFTYKANDGTSDSNVALVAIKVNGAPVANNDSATTNKNIAVTVTVLANDTDPNGDTLTVTSLSQPASGTAVLNANGTVTYTPNSGFADSDSFTYKASDGMSESSVATVTIRVNTPPVATSDTATTNRNAPVTISVLTNDTDADGNTLSVSSLTQPTNGTVVVNANGIVTYTPKTGFVGTDTFTYKANDGASESNAATVTVTVVNRPPVAVNDVATSTKNTTVIIRVLANYSDPDGDPLTITGLIQPTNGTIILNADGTISYTPKKTFTGTDTFTYKLTDGLAQSNTATVTITIS